MCAAGAAYVEGNCEQPGFKNFPIGLSFERGTDVHPSDTEYRLIAKKGEGTFSEVLKAQCVKNGKMTAIKCMKSQFESEEQVHAA